MTHTLIYPHTTVAQRRRAPRDRRLRRRRPGARVRHAAVHLRRADAARPVPRLPRRLRRAHRPLRDRVREQGVQLPRDGGAGRAGGPVAGRRHRRRAGGRARRRLPAGAHLLPRQQQVGGRDRGRPRRRHRPLRRRLVRGDRAAGGGRGRPRPRPGRARARHAGRAPQHARLHPDRPAGQQVRLRAGRRARARGGAPPQGRAPPRARRRARAHRLADLRARLVPARGRGALRRHRRLAPRLRLRVPHLQHRRRARHPLHHRRPAQLHRRVRGDRRRTRSAPAPSKHGLPMPQALRRAGAQHRRQGGRHRVHGGDRQGHPRRAHLRGRGRRHERQPAADALRLQVRGDAGEQGGGAGDGRGHRRRQALRVGRRAGARRARRAARAGRHPRHARAPAPTATRWPTTTTRSRARPWSWSAAAGRASSSSERPGTTCCACSARSPRDASRQRRAPQWTR